MSSWQSVGPQHLLSAVKRFYPNSVLLLLLAEWYPRHEFFRAMYLTCIVLVALTVTEQACSIHSQARRSSKWDAFHEHTRARRDLKCSYEKNGCSIPDVTLYDKLGRRNSGKLELPQEQGNCGGCWAFAAAHTYADWVNLYVSPHGTTQLPSVDYLIKCVDASLVAGGNGCCGAKELYGGLDAIKANPGVTDSCLSYSLTTYPPAYEDLNCSSFLKEKLREEYKRRNPLTCPDTCDNGQTLNPTGVQPVDFSHEGLSDDDAVIEGLKKGPVMMGFNVYSDIYYYKCGVYHSDMSKYPYQGGHAVEIVDYGTTNTGCDFWIVKNS